MPAIIAGKRKGAKLQVPEGIGVRPTLARVREALFSMLTSTCGSLEGKIVLDPFAGAGLLGLEAWSRGAAHVDLVEMSRPHIQVLRKNIQSLRAPRTEVEVMAGPSPNDWGRVLSRRYDLVLCDPPYAAGLMPQTLDALVSGEWLRPDAVVSVELNARDSLELPECWELVRERKYGICKILLLRKTQ